MEILRPLRISGPSCLSCLTNLERYPLSDAASLDDAKTKYEFQTTRYANGQCSNLKFFVSKLGRYPRRQLCQPSRMDILGSRIHQL